VPVGADVSGRGLGAICGFGFVQVISVERMAAQLLEVGNLKGWPRVLHVMRNWVF
jgi:hypothetical protein